MQIVIQSHANCTGLLYMKYCNTYAVFAAAGLIGTGPFCAIPPPRIPVPAGDGW